MHIKEADENGSDGLDIDEFRAAFGQILGKGKNDQQVKGLHVLHHNKVVITDGNNVYEDRY